MPVKRCSPPSRRGNASPKHSETLRTQQDGGNKKAPTGAAKDTEKPGLRTLLWETARPLLEPGCAAEGSPSQEATHHVTPFIGGVLKRRVHGDR